MITKRTARAAVAAATMALAASMTGMGSAQAADVEYWPGKDVTVGSCKGWINKRTSDGYVQAVGQSWGDTCLVWLERKRLGTGGYDWTAVTNYYVVQSYPTTTGFHWNGTDAGSRVCISNGTTGGSACGAGAW